MPTIDKATFELIIKYCEYAYAHSPPVLEKPLRSGLKESLEDQWYFEFIDLDQLELFEIVLAANYLHIQPLLELASAKICTIIKTMSIPQIREYFAIENDFTPEEEAQVVQENKWAEESF